MKIKFLLVDDSVSILNVLSSLISAIMTEFPEIKYDLDKFDSFQSFIKGKKEEYDIAIIDWNLPDGKKGSNVIDLLTCNAEKFIYSGINKSITIYTGMVDDNLSIGEYANSKKIRYISKGDDPSVIRNYIENSIKKITKNKKVS